MKWTCNPIIAIDTREQLSWQRHFHNLSSCVTTLHTGDYSVVGLTHRICVERKSLSDLLSTIGQGREPDAQFMRRLARMQRFRYRLLVVEASLAEIYQGDWAHSRQKPAQVIGNLQAWDIQHGVPWIPAGTPIAAAAYAERWLYQCAVRELKMPIHRCETQPPLVTIQWDWQAKLWTLLDSAREHDRWRDVTSCPYCQEELSNPETEAK